MVVWYSCSNDLGWLLVEMETKTGGVGYIVARDLCVWSVVGARKRRNLVDYFVLIENSKFAEAGS